MSELCESALDEVIASCWGLHDAASLTLGPARRSQLSTLARQLERLEEFADDNGRSIDELGMCLALVLHSVISLLSESPPRTGAAP